MGRRRALAVVAVAELLAMSLWFSATAAAPELATEWGLTPGGTALLTTAVQLGFVTGALLSSALTLSDVVRPRYLFAGSALAGAGFTALIAFAVETATPAIALRFLTGMALAGVYPPGMKLLTGWFREGRGFAIGVLVGALTVGSALPHPIRAVGGVGQARTVLYGTAALATGGGLLALRVEPGPHQAPAAPFDPGAVGRILRDRATMLANGGYFGHMWELYAVWTWIPAFLVASTAALGGAPSAASLVAFGTIAVGGAGAMAAGSAADRLGRTTVTTASLAVSGIACLTVGLLFGGSLVVLVPFLLVWGFAIVADSAQFSVAVSELAEDSYVGTDPADGSRLPADDRLHPTGAGAGRGGRLAVGIRTAGGWPARGYRLDAVAPGSAGGRPAGGRPRVARRLHREHRLAGVADDVLGGLAQ